MLNSAGLKLSSFSSEGGVLQTPRKGVYVIFPKRTSGNDYHTQMTRHRNNLFRFLRVGSVERYDPVFKVWSELELRENFSRWL